MFAAVDTATIGDNLQGYTIWPTYPYQQPPVQYVPYPVYTAPWIIRLPPDKSAIEELIKQVKRLADAMEKKNGRRSK